MANATLYLKNNLRQQLTNDYVAGAGVITVPNGPEWDDPEGNAPAADHAILGTAFRQADLTTPVVIFKFTARTGHVLTIGEVVWGTDQNLEDGDVLACTPAAEYFADLAAAIAAGGGGGGAGAPTDAVYIVASASSGLSAERVATDTATIAWDFTTAAQAKLNVVDGSITTTKLGGDITTAGKALLDDANATAQRATLSVYSTAEVDTALAGKSNTGHTHTTDEVTEATNLYYTDARVRANRLDQMATPTADVSMGGVKVTNLGTPTSGNDAVTKTYADSLVTGLLDFKGSIDASTNPNYPAASKGDAYYVSVAGLVGGGSGKGVDIGDLVVASADNAGGTEASVGTSWFVLEHNLVGALLAANNLSDLASASTARTNLGLGTAAVENTTAFAAASHVHAASDITSGTIATARLGSGTANSSTFLRGDQTWATPTAGAGGSDGQVQYNSSGSLAGVSKVTVSANGNFLLTAQTTPGSLSDGELYQGSQKTLSGRINGVTHHFVGCLFTGDNTVTVANTVTETTLIGTGHGTLTLPANFLVAGKTIRIWASGLYGTAASGSPTINLKFKLGSTVIGSTGAQSTSNAQSNQGWDVVFIFTCRSAGASGTVMGQGIHRRYNSANNATNGAVQITNSGTVTIDTTASLTLDITCTWGAADAANTKSLTNLLVEVLN